MIDGIAPTSRLYRYFPLLFVLTTQYSTNVLRGDRFKKRDVLQDCVTSHKYCLALSWYSGIAYVTDSRDDSSLPVQTVRCGSPSCALWSVLITTVDFVNTVVTLVGLVDESLNCVSRMQKKNQGRIAGTNRIEYRTRDSPGLCVRQTRRGLMFVIMSLVAMHQSRKKKNAPLPAVHDRDGFFSTKYGAV